MIINLLLILFSFVFVGFTALYILNYQNKQGVLYDISLSYPLGVVLLTIQMMLYSFIGIHWTSISILIPWLILFTAGWFIKKRLFKVQIKVGKTSLIDKVFFIMILLTVFFVLFEASIHPLAAFDGWANWFLAGKAYFLQGKIDPRYILYSDNSNPPLINLLVSYVYLLNGKVNDQLGILFFSFLYVSMLVIFYFLARNFLSKRYALLFTFLLASVENVIRQAGRFDVGYADLPLGYFIFLSTMFLFLYLKSRSLKELILFNIFSLAAALTKTEGVPFLLFSQSLLFYFLFKRREMKNSLFSSLALLPLLSWYIFKHKFNLPENPFFQNQIHFDRLFIIFKLEIQEFLNIVRWNLLWISFFITIPIGLLNKRSRLIFFVCLIQLSVYFIIYLTTPVEVTGHIQSSFDRLLLHITPTAMLAIVLVFSENKIV